MLNQWQSEDEDEDDVMWATMGALTDLPVVMTRGLMTAAQEDRESALILVVTAGRCYLPLTLLMTQAPGEVPPSWHNQDLRPIGWIWTSRDDRPDSQIPLDVVVERVAPDVLTFPSAPLTTWGRLQGLEMHMEDHLTPQYQDAVNRLTRTWMPANYRHIM